MRTRVKTCCISSAAEVGWAVRLGADALGGPGMIDAAARPGVDPQRPRRFVAAAAAA